MDNTLAINIVDEIKSIINISKTNAIKSVDFERTKMYWQIGKRIFEEEQNSQDRANYGDYLTVYLSSKLEPEFGSGFSKRQLELFRQFYRSFSNANTLYSQI